jgi:hypothetical protein
MFETILQRILTGLGASDQLISTMGPSLSIVLAIAGGTAAAQFFKYPLSRAIPDDGLFSWTVRATAVLVTFVLALFLTDTMTWPLALVFSFLQLAVYHVSLAMIRRWWPWLEDHKAVGSMSKTKDNGEESGV